MARLTRMQKHIMAQVKTLADGHYLSLPWRSIRTVRALHSMGLISYHNDGPRWHVVAAGNLSYLAKVEVVGQVKQ